MLPITFLPLLMERVWGGRELATRLQRDVSEDKLIGESWEIADRPEAQSVVNSGEWTGLSLHDLWNRHRTEVFGSRYADFGPHFPILCKILDARDRLSIQVHPPATIAPQLDGEPKTEMWFFLSCDLGSQIYAGLQPEVTRESFEKHLLSGSVEECVQTLPTKNGDSIFIPSGRLHAIGRGNLIIEIQQNSDTTYRVFDWNRVGLDGTPRELHVEEALASIDFDDREIKLDHINSGTLAECPYFRVTRRMLSDADFLSSPDDFAIVTIIEGKALCADRIFSVGDFFLLPAKDAPAVAPIGTPCSLLVTTIP